MNNKMKYALIGLGVLATSTIAFFAVKYYKLKKAYNTVLTESEAMRVINDRFGEIDESEIDYDEAYKEFGVVDKGDSTGVVLGSEGEFDEFFDICEKDPEYCNQLLNEF